MAVAISVVSSSRVDSHTNMAMKSCGELISQRRAIKRKNLITRPRSLELGSSFLDSWYGWRPSRKVVLANGSLRRRPPSRKLLVVNELAGQYEDSFEDVKLQTLNYFTYKAARTVLNQLYEMNPTQYMWFYDFVASNKPGDGKRFIRTLGKENHELAERVMATRLHLYGKWVKKCNHAEIYQEISDENLELMRERLIETVIWPSDDSNTQKIG